MTESTIILVTGEEMGRAEPALGRRLLTSFFGALLGVEPKPEAIVFYNSAVKVLAPPSPDLDTLRELDAAGVDLLACITCLEYFSLVDDLAVGEVTNMREIAQRTMRATKVVTL